MYSDHEIDWGFNASMNAIDNKQKIQELQKRINQLEKEGWSIPEQIALEPRLADAVSPNGHEIVSLDVRDAAPAEPGPGPAYSTRMLHRDNPEDWGWVPDAMGRVRRFCYDHEAQADADLLVKNLQQWFVLDDPNFMVVGIFRDERFLIGHMMCERSLLYLKPIVTIHQYSLDHGAPPDIRHGAVELVKEWARETGPQNDRAPAEFIQWLVSDKKLVTLYQRLYKAKPHLLVMRLPVEGA